MTTPGQRAELVEQTEEETMGEVHPLTEAAERDFATHDDILEAFPRAEESLDEFEDILVTVDDSAIDIGSPAEKKTKSGLAASRESGPQAVEQVDQQAYFDAVAADDLITLYRFEIRRVPLLVADEEVALAKRMEAGKHSEEKLSNEGLGPAERKEFELIVKDGLAAREHLILANCRLVVSVARKYTYKGVLFLDLIQEGNIGLIRAVDKFDYKLGYRFSTNATEWIRREVTRAIAEQSRTIRLPVHVGDQLNELWRTTDHLRQKLKRQPTTEDVATALKVARRRVEEMLRVARRHLSLERPTDDEEDSELGDSIEDRDSPSPADEAERSNLRELLEEILNDLPPRGVRVLQMRFGLVGGKTYTLEEVGEELRVTPQQVRQIENQALERLQEPDMVSRLRVE